MPAVATETKPMEEVLRSPLMALEMTRFVVLAVPLAVIPVVEAKSTVSLFPVGS